MKKAARGAVGSNLLLCTSRFVLCLNSCSCSSDTRCWTVSVGEVCGERRVLLDNLASPFLNTLSRQALLPNGEGALGNRAGEFH